MRAQNSDGVFRSLIPKPSRSGYSGGMGNQSLLETRPTVMEVDLSALSHNFQKIRERVGQAKVMAVVKANAYGHGLIECGLHFERCGVDFIGCAYLEEGLILRAAGVRIPILVFGGLVADQVDRYIQNNIDITASSLSKLEQIEQVAATLKHRARVHLKIDTGMERLGVHYYSAESLLERTLTLKWCDVMGIFSHFSSADRVDQTVTNLQLERFLECLNFYSRHSLETPIRHIANSSAVILNQATHLDMVRPGIAMYGVMPSDDVENKLGLKPAMSIYSRVVYFKVVKKGNGVSYSHLWRAPEDTRVVTIPIGYGDGYPRSLTNNVDVLIRGKRYPGVGAICMDQMMVNIGHGEAFNGDEITVVGSDGDQTISIAELAKRANTIPYEILVGINTRIPRIYRNVEPLHG